MKLHRSIDEFTDQLISNHVNTCNTYTNKMFKTF